jgi:hypothetical protein
MIDWWPPAAALPPPFLLDTSSLHSSAAAAFYFHPIFALAEVGVLYIFQFYSVFSAIARSFRAFLLSIVFFSSSITVHSDNHTLLSAAKIQEKGRRRENRRKGVKMGVLLK